MTSLHRTLRNAAENALDVALNFLACGLDPKKSVFWKQSDVPEVTELTWLLSTVTPMSLLEKCRCAQRQDRQRHRAEPRPLRLSGAHGGRHPHLLNVVPVGRDQKQHVEVARDIAIRV